ncbi:MAG: hypothetical protein P8M22_10515 [Phycisphaerales bacterium]|nr:hypothetical protein [Phycisphaerales bacterium]
MARRSNRPALYELTQTQADRSGPVQESGVERGEEAVPATTWLTPGAGIRVPGGFLFLGAVLLVAFVCLAWWIGYRQGASRTESLMAASPGGVLVDPLLVQSQMVPPEQNQEAQEPQEPLWGSGTILDSQNPWHFVLAETNLAGAERLAGFCRGQGLEVLVVPRHNTGLARVIALPGMATSSRKTEKVRAQEARIAELGRQWKRNGGRTDFSDRYVDRIVAVIE